MGNLWEVFNFGIGNKDNTQTDSAGSKGARKSFQYMNEKCKFDQRIFES